MRQTDRDIETVQKDSGPLANTHEDYSVWIGILLILEIFSWFLKTTFGSIIVLVSVWGYSWVWVKYLGCSVSLLTVHTMTRVTPFPNYSLMQYICYLKLTNMHNLLSLFLFQFFTFSNDQISPFRFLKILKNFSLTFISFPEYLWNILPYSVFLSENSIFSTEWYFNEGSQFMWADEKFLISLFQAATPTALLTHTQFQVKQHSTYLHFHKIVSYSHYSKEGIAYACLLTPSVCNLNRLPMSRAIKTYII